MANSTELEWWRGAVIYQIYPRSYADSTGDGVGDLKGILGKLPYLQDLGVDAIWISPFFTSPMKDFGYDVSDYRDVDDLFGSLADFKAVLDDAHGRDMKIVIDQVYSHSSDQHAWFEESRQDRTNAKADWYVWADAEPDGTVPNNWLSFFGGPAWQWDSRRQQYFQHNFLASQPDLNFHNPEVHDAILDVAKFWLDLGVDGFRLDTVNMFTHDRELRDNPVVTQPHHQFVGMDEKNPFARQYHCHQLTQPENLVFLQKLRTLMDGYSSDRFTVGEIGAPEGLKVMAEYTSGNDKLHSAYTFELLNTPHSAEYLRTTLEGVEGALGDGWPCFSLSNHDVVRSATRWGSDTDGSPLDRASFAKISLAFLLSLRGTTCIYQGEELGLPEAEVAFDDLQDPFGIEFWPDFVGRDGCRTPMVWSADGGFSDGDTPWLPIADTHLPLNPETQAADPDSVLSFVRSFLAWRKSQPALITGSFVWHDLHAHVITFERANADQRLLVLLNMTGSTHEFPLPNELTSGTTDTAQTIGVSPTITNSSATLPPLSGAIINLT